MLLALSVISDQGASLGPTAYKVFDERGGSIGRVNSNDWVLPDAEKLVSTRHAQIRCVDGAFFIEDASTNGTYLNGAERRVPKEAPALLQDGDRIQIGDYQILVQLIDDSASNGQIASLPVNPLPLSAAQPLSTATLPFGMNGGQMGRATLTTPPRSVIPPIAEPMPAIPPEPKVNLTGRPDDLLLLLGLDPVHVDPAIHAQLGHILRIVVQGLIDVLNSRAEVKSQFRMTMTNIRPIENNPLKFSMNAEDALHNLFVKRNPGYLPPTEAFREGFQDIAFHQMAMLAGVRSAFNAMLASFHPDHLQSVYERKLRRTSLIGGFANRLRYWGMYRTQFEDIEANMESYFQSMFGEEFAKAYSEQLEQLGAAARRGTR